MRRLALATLAAVALLVGGAQARIVSSSVEAGQQPDAETSALLTHPAHGAMFEVRASPRAPAVVRWRIHCRSRTRNRVSRHRITSDKLPIRVRMPVLVSQARYCNLSGDASYKSFVQTGRIAAFIRY